MSVTWQLEDLRIKGGTAFILGWVFCESSSIVELTADLNSREGRNIGSFALQANCPRVDVQAAFDNRKGSLYSGFVGIGGWKTRVKKSDSLTLRAILDDGTCIQYNVPYESFSSSLVQDRTPIWWLRLQIFRSYLRRGFLLLKARNIKGLLDRIARFSKLYLSSFSTSRLAQSPQRYLRPAFLEASPSHLIVDHQLGGGANEYRDRQVGLWLKQGCTVLVLTYDIRMMQNILSVITNQQRTQLVLRDDHDILTALKHYHLLSITYNTAVSYPNANKIPQLLLTLKKVTGAKIIFLLHDFFSLCPSHFLLDKTGNYCAVPDYSVCNSCLVSNSHGFTSLYSGDIRQWRNAWGPLLQAADNIVVFSSSSAAILRSAYDSRIDGVNWLQGKTIEILPHSVDYIQPISKAIISHDTLTIGVIGQIGIHKGSSFVRELANEIAAQGGDESIAVIGSIECYVDNRVVTQSGRYDKRELPSLISKMGVNIVLFPSIWPETFSYVVQEVIQCEIPLACFDLGAPAERVRSYDKGLVLTTQDPRTVLLQLRQFFADLYTR